MLRGYIDTKRTLGGTSDMYTHARPPSCMLDSGVKPKTSTLAAERERPADLRGLGNRSCSSHGYLAVCAPLHGLHAPSRLCSALKFPTKSLCYRCIHAKTTELVQRRNRHVTLRKMGFGRLSKHLYDEIQLYFRNLYRLFAISIAFWPTCPVYDGLRRWPAR